MNSNVSYITDNFDFHRSEYMIIRPWIQDRLKQLDIKCELNYDNESLFIIKSIADIEYEISKDNIKDLIRNKRSTEFFQEYKINYGFDEIVNIIDILDHEHATTIMKDMLDAMLIFERFEDDDRDVNISKLIDEDVLYIILAGMSNDDANIVKRGIDDLKNLIIELGDHMLYEIRLAIAEKISNKESSVDFINANKSFIDHDSVALNPRFREVKNYDELSNMMIESYYVSRNYGAFDRLKQLNPKDIEWDRATKYHRDVQFMEANINYLHLGKCKTEEHNIIMNDYMMPFIERHIEEFDPSLCALSSNASAIDYLERHPELINERILSNPNIVTYDYDAIKLDHQNLHRDLHEYLYHPYRIQKWIDADNDLYDYLNI